MLAKASQRCAIKLGWAKEIDIERRTDPVAVLLELLSDLVIADFRAGGDERREVLTCQALQGTPEVTRLTVQHLVESLSDHRPQDRVIQVTSDQFAQRKDRDLLQLLQA
jgi:hypothetical protein